MVADLEAGVFELNQPFYISGVVCARDAVIGRLAISANRPDRLACPEPEIPKQGVHLAPGLKRLRVRIVEDRKCKSSPFGPLGTRHKSVLKALLETSAPERSSPPHRSPSRNTV